MVSEALRQRFPDGQNAPPGADLSAAGFPKGGRPPKIANPLRWHLIVDRKVRERAERRAARRGEELPDVLRALMADYAAGRVQPSGTKVRVVPGELE